MPLLSVLHHKNDTTVLNYECTTGALNATLVDIANSSNSNTTPIAGSNNNNNTNGASHSSSRKNVGGSTINSPTNAYGAESTKGNNNNNAPDIVDGSTTRKYRRMELIPLNFVTDLVSNSKVVSALSLIYNKDSSSSGSKDGGKDAPQPSAAAAAPAATSPGLSMTSSTTSMNSLLQNIPFIGVLSAAVTSPAAELPLIASNGTYVLLGCRESEDSLHGNENGLARFLDEQDEYLRNYELSKVKKPRAIQFAGGSGGGAVVSGLLYPVLPRTVSASQHNMVAIDAVPAADADKAPSTPEEIALLLQQADRASKLSRPERTHRETDYPSTRHSAPALVNVAAVVNTGNTNSKGGGGGEDLTCILYGPRRLVTEQLPPPPPTEEELAARGSMTQGSSSQLNGTSEGTLLPSEATAPPAPAAIGRTAAKAAAAEPSARGRKNNANTNNNNNNVSEKNSRSASKTGKGGSNAAASSSAAEAEKAVPHEVQAIPLSKAAQHLLSLEPLPISVNMNTAAVAGRSNNIFNEKAPPLGVKPGEHVAPPSHMASITSKHVLEEVSGFDVLWHGPRGEHEVLSWLLAEYMKLVRQRIQAVRAQQQSSLTETTQNSGDAKRKKGKR